MGSLQDQALLLALAGFPGKQSSACGVLEHLSHALVGLGGAFEVLAGTDLLADFLSLGLFVSMMFLLALLKALLFQACPYLLGSDGLLRRLVQLLNSLLVVSQILLAADEDDGEARAEVQDLGDPL